MDRARNLSGGTPAIELPGLRFALGEDIDMLRATVRGFAQAEIAPRAAEIDRSNQFPSDLWRKMGVLGLLGRTVEEAYGGTLMGYAARTPISASTRSAGTEARLRSANTSRSSSQASGSARSPCPSPVQART